MKNRIRMCECIGWGGRSGRVESQKVLINKVAFKYRLELCQRVRQEQSGKCQLLKIKGQLIQDTLIGHIMFTEHHNIQ